MDGVVLVVKNRDVDARITDAFTHRRVEKTYLALVTGVPADSLTIDGTPSAPSSTPSYPGPASAPAAHPSQDSVPSAVQGATTTPTPDAGLAAEPAALSAEVATVPPAAPDQAH